MQIANRFTDPLLKKFLGQGMVYIKQKGNSQNNRYWCSEITMQFKLECGVQCVHSKPEGLCFLKKETPNDAMG